jgi:hypothetical protein
MKKDYSKLFDHYYGLQYDHNVAAMIKVHQLMEDAGIVPDGSTSDKLGRYSDKRPFKVHFFISKVGKKLKWCPTNSQEKLDKMILQPAEWWIDQLEDKKPIVAHFPDNWLDEQAQHVATILALASEKFSTNIYVDVFNEEPTPAVDSDYEELPF